MSCAIGQLEAQAACATERSIKIDRAISARFSRASTGPPVRHFFRAVSWLGNGYFWYALIAFLVAWYDRAAWYPVLHMIVAGLSGALIYKRLKKSTLRPRPFTLHKEIAQGVASLDQYSFPSGHMLHGRHLRLLRLFIFRH